MTIWIIYLLVGLGASVFGALAGLGGGIIIKPVLDTLGDYDVGTIGILSAATVFSMSIVSLISSRHNHDKINVKQSLLIAIGSIVGGSIGKLLFNYLIQLINVSDIVTVIQAVMIAILMIMIYILVNHRNKMKTRQIQNAYTIIAIGFLLGLIAAFLGIGGGPFNVAILSLLFAMEAKEAALNSIFIIFFSQLSSLLYTTFTTGFASFNLSMLPFMIVGGMVGGLLGTRLSKSVSNQLVEKIFMSSIIIVIFINCFNIARFFIT